MPAWSDDFRRFLDARFGTPPDGDAFRARFDWVAEVHALARELLDPASLRAMPPEEVYGRIEALSVPQCPIRLTNLGRVNDAARITESLLKLLETKGGFEAKYQAAKFPQAGVVTITELLCVAKPMRFVLRNTAFTRAAAKVVPFYTKKALDELPYEEFLDTCRELTRVLEAYLAPVGLGEFAKTHRFLLLYAVLTAKDA